MRCHRDRDRGVMGAALLTVLGIFLAIHLAAPEVTLWPALLVSLGVVSMLVSHIKRNRHGSREVAASSIEEGGR